MDINNQDIYLLENDPNNLVLKYLPVIKNLVAKKLIIPGYMLHQDKDDIVQEIVHGLLKDMGNIREAYNGHAKFEPFFVKIIINRCNEIRRKGFRQETREVKIDNPDNPGFEKKIKYIRRNTVAQILNNNFPENLNETDKNTIISSELEYLDLVFRLYPVRKTRLFIYLKILTGHEVSEVELKTFNNNCDQSVYEGLVEISGQSGRNTKEQCYRALTDFFNCCDKTSKNYDTVRKEVDKVLHEVIIQMNRDSGSQVYDKKNIWSLIELFFEWKENNS